MSKYILYILDAMGNIVNYPYSSPEQSVQAHEAGSLDDDVDALRSDWSKIGQDFKKSSTQFIEAQ